MFGYNCINTFLSKLEVIKLFECDKYRSTLFNKITIKYMERERERERG